MRPTILAATTAVVLVHALSVDAAPITMTFTGQLQPGAPAAFASVLGTGELTGTLTFESSTPDSLPLNSSQGFYVGAVTAFSFTLGSYQGTFAGHNPGTGVAVQNAAQDRFTASALFSGVAVTGSGVTYTPDFVAMILGDPTGTAFSSDLLQVPDFADFSAGIFSLFFRTNPTDPLSAISFAADITSLTLVPTADAVPEPGSLLLLGTGVVAAVRRSRSRASR